MNLVDLIIIIILLIFIVRGFSRGFLRGIAGLIGLSVALILAVQFMDDLSRILLRFFALSPQTAVLLTAVIIFFVVFLGFILAAKVIRSVLSMVALGWVDRIAGGILGLLKGSIIVSIIVLMISLFPFRGQFRTELNDSLLFKPAKQIAPAVFDLLTKSLPIAGDFYEELRQSFTNISGDINIDALKWLETLRKQSPDPNQL